MKNERRNQERTDSVNLLDYQVIDQQGRAGAYSLGRTLNISDDGMLMEPQTQMELGELILITLDLGGKLVRISGKIVHTSGNGGAFRAGIKFFNISEEERVAINNYIEFFQKEYRASDKQDA